MKICLIIPAYNEAENIDKVITDIKSNLSSCGYVFINDCSTDNTKQILEEKNLNFIDLPINLGLAGAVQTGYKYAYENGYDCVIQFDGDGQHQAKYVMNLAKEIENGANIAIGSRFVEKKKNWSLRMLGSRILSVLIFIRTAQVIKDPTSGFRMLDREMMFDYAYNVNRKPEPDTLAYQMIKGAKVKEVQVEMLDREAGESIYTGLFSSIKYMVKMIITIIFIL